MPVHYRNVDENNEEEDLMINVDGWKLQSKQQAP
jgi:hypothetical protein